MIIQTNHLYTAQISRTFGSNASIGSLFTSSGNNDLDNSTSVDGIVLPLVHPNVRSQMLSWPGYTITNAVDLGTYKNIRLFRVSSSSFPRLKLKDAISIGDISSASRVGFFRVEQLSGSDIIIGCQASTAPSTLTASSLIGQKIYTIHQFSGIAELGFASLAFGTGTTSIAKIRVALVLTNTPGGSSNFTTRFNANEVIWSRFYPFGSQITIDFGGISVYGNGWIPGTSFAPATGANAEKRLMLCLYLETGSVTETSWELDVDITYNIKTVVDRQPDY